MKNSLQQQFNHYSLSHQNAINQHIHSIAVPLIYCSVLGLFWAIPVPDYIATITALNFSFVAAAIISLFYLFRSISIAFGIIVLSALSLIIFQQLEQHISIALLSLFIFIVAWIAQFIGHGIEGKKPSFFEDLSYLLIGPGWVIAKFYRRFNIPY